VGNHSEEHHLIMDFIADSAQHVELPRILMPKIAVQNGATNQNRRLRHNPSPAGDRNCIDHLDLPKQFTRPILQRKWISHTTPFQGRCTRGARLPVQLQEEHKPGHLHLYIYIRFSVGIVFIKSSVSHSLKAVDTTEEPSCGAIAC
jgi:hypothetical protein